jgi:hypothetical protein
MAGKCVNATYRLLRHDLGIVDRWQRVTGSFYCLGKAFSGHVRACQTKPSKVTLGPNEHRSAGLSSRYYVAQASHYGILR